MNMFEIVDPQCGKAVIKVFGVGGGGSNAVKHMIRSHVNGVEFICANTDSQALVDIEAKTTLQLGNNITKGLGAGANPDVGRQAALEDRDRITELLQGTDMVFITAGMGGGTGTGAAPVVAEVAREMGILSVAVVTKPFGFEGKRRMVNAEKGIVELSQYVDSLITIPNQKLMDALGSKVQLKQAFEEANNVLFGAVQGIADLITRHGIINVDFADVKTVMSEMGMAMMGTGIASGENRAVIAAKGAISSPLLDDIDLMGARGILVNITASDSFELGEFQEVGDTIREFAADNATVIVGVVEDNTMEDRIKVTVVATGLGPVVTAQAAKEPVIEKPVQAATPAAKVVPAPVKKDEIPTLEAAQIVGPVTDYSRYDVPPTMRNPGVPRQPRTLSAATVANRKQALSEDMAMLDIPAFLRRQAD